MPRDVELISLSPLEDPEVVRDGLCCAYEVYFRECGLSFPLPELLIHFMHDLGIALAQICPNLIRTVVGLQVLAEENGFELDVESLVRLESVRGVRNQPGFFYSMSNPRCSILSGFPKKDEDWKQSYFYFPVNESTFGRLSHLAILDWSSEPVLPPKKGGKLPKLSRDLVDFICACSSAKSIWGTFDSDRISESAQRLRSLDETQHPPLPPDELAALDDNQDIKMSSYRAARKAKNVVAQDAGVPARREEPLAASSVPAAPLPASSDKGAKRDGKAPMVSADHAALAKLGRRLVIALPVSQDAPRHAEGAPLSRGPLKRKFQEQGNKKGDGKRMKYDWDFDYKSNKSIVTDSDSSSHLFRHFRFEGCKVPAIPDIPEEVRDLYKKYSKSVGESLGWYNSVVELFGNQLAASKDGSGLKAAEDKVASLTAELRDSRKRMERAETKAMNEKEDRIDLGEKFRFLHAENIALLKGKIALEANKVALASRLEEAEARLKALTSSREIDAARAREEAKKAVAETVRDGIEQVRLHIAARDGARDSLVYFREINANLELLMDIDKGEVPDLKAELEVLTADCKAARKASDEAKAKIPPFDFEEFVQLFSGSPPQPSVSEPKLPSPAATLVLTPDGVMLASPPDLGTDVPTTTSADASVLIDEFGSNNGPNMDEMVEGIRAATEEDPAQT